MAWHVIDSNGRVAGIGECEKSAWRAAEEHTDHELRDLLGVGYRAQFIGLSDRQLGRACAAITIPCIAGIAWAVWRYLL